MTINLQPTTGARSVTYELPCTDGRKSFYGKAKVNLFCNMATLWSYTTPVIQYNLETGELNRLWGGYSATTMRHVNSFMDHIGIEGGGKAWWDSMEVSK